MRAEAERLGLPVAAKPDSQDICFVPAGSYADVVGKLRPDALAPGEIVDAAGTVLGRHDGIARYTVGQARRLGGAAAPATGGGGAGCGHAGGWWSARAPRATCDVALRATNWLAPLPPEGAALHGEAARARRAAPGMGAAGRGWRGVGAAR